MSLTKCSLSVSMAWCGLRHPSLQGERETLTIMTQRKRVKEQRVKTTREGSLGLSALSRQGNFADATVSLEE